MGIEDKALAVRECKVVLWRQDIQNNSTGNIITDLGSNCGKQSKYPLEEHSEEKNSRNTWIYMADFSLW